MASQLWTIDEHTYLTLARQVKRDWRDYNTLAFTEAYAKAGRPLPEYYHKPLFKHPPLSIFLMAGALKVFGENPFGGIFVSAFLGAALIPLVYFLGMLFYGKRVGLLAAFFAWIDPVSIISSQKMWMDTTLSFFMVLAVFLFAYGLRKSKDNYFIWGGVATGFAILTKYPGILPLIILVVYALIFDAGLMKKRKYQTGMILPFMMLIPWVFWNFKTYGAEFITQILGTHDFLKINLRIGVILVLAMVIVGAIIFRKLAGKHRKTIDRSSKNLISENIEEASYEESGFRNNLRFIGKGILALVLAFFLLPHIIESLNLFHLPYVTWYMGQFSDPLFYFWRLIEFCLLYVFSFAAFFMLNEKELQERAFLYVAPLVILIFFLLWGNYQSRYILAALPFLMVISMGFCVKWWDKIQLHENLAIRTLAKAALLLILVYAFSKTAYINQVLSFPSDMCYF